MPKPKKSQTLKNNKAVNKTINGNKHIATVTSIKAGTEFGAQKTPTYHV